MHAEFVWTNKPTLFSRVRGPNFSAAKNTNTMWLWLLIGTPIVLVLAMIAYMAYTERTMGSKIRNVKSIVLIRL